MLLLKLVMMPSLMWAVSMAGRRWGPAIVGWLVGLPLIGGMVVLFLALEQGKSFAAASSLGTLKGMVALSVYCAIYARVSQHANWFMSLMAGWVGFFGTAALMPLLPSTILFVSVAGFSALYLGVLACPLITQRDLPILAPRGEIVLRMAAATGLLLAITGIAARLGPQWSGILTPFPIISSILPVFTHRGAGGAAAARLLRGTLLGLFSFAFFFLVLAVALDRLGIAAGFVLASAGALLVHGLSMRFLR